MQSNGISYKLQAVLIPLKGVSFSLEKVASRICAIYFETFVFCNESVYESLSHIVENCSDSVELIVPTLKRGNIIVMNVSNS